MAIKGKSRPKARKTVTSGPKPVYVTPKRPLLLRRGFQVGALIVAVVLATSGIAYGLHKEHQRQAAAELKASETKYIGQFKTQVASALSGAGQANQTSGFDVLPNLTSAISGLQAGSTSATDAATTARSSASAAKDAYTKLNAINARQLVGGHGFDLSLSTSVFNAQSGMVNGLKLYEQLANALGDAARSTGAARTHLLSVATGSLPTAKAVFDKGYLDFVDAQNTAGIFAPPVGYQQPGGFPPGAGVPPGAGAPPAVPAPGGQGGGGGGGPGGSNGG